MSDRSLNIFALAGKYGDRPALVAQEKVFTFTDLAARARPVAQQLKAICGAAGFTRVSLPVHNDLDTVVTLLSLLSVRIPFVPVHPRLTNSERATLEGLSGASVRLSRSDIEALTRSPGSDSSLREPEAFSVRCAMVMFTSGVSGTPKGAVLSHDALIAAAEASAANLGWCENDRWVLCLPLCHVGGLSILTRCLLAGQCVIMTGSSEAQEVLDASATHGGTLLSVVPTVLQRLLALDAENTLSRFRAILLGGASASSALLAACEQRDLPVLRTYGLTEACSQVTTESPVRKKGAHRSCGRPLSGIGVRVLNRDGFEALPGEAGRIWIRGPVMMDGYLGQAPLKEGDEFDTGDIGYLDQEGALHVNGRADDTIITGGENVYPLEVEAVLSQSPEVATCVVFGVDDAQWGQVVAAALVLKSGAIYNARTLSEFAVRHLSAHRRPRQVAVWSAFPLLPGGKIDRRRVAKESVERLQKIQF